MHYARFKKWGDANFIKEAHFADPEEAFTARTVWRGDCLEWTGATYPAGYGQMRINNRIVRTHRYAWERVHGEIPEGMIIDHMCFNPACCNVEHLRLGTEGLNRQNLSGAYRSSASQIRGVRFHRASGLWMSRVTVNRIDHVKYSKTVEEAEQKAIAMRRALMPFSQEPELSHEH